MSPQEIPIVPAFTPVLKPISNPNPVLNFLHPVPPMAIYPALKISHGQDISTEVIKKRSLHSKTYQTGPEEFKVITGQSIIHYESNGKMEEVDLRIEDIDGKKVVTKAPYKLEIFTDKVGYYLEQPDGSHFTIELVKIGDRPVNNAFLQSTVNDCQLFWDGLVTDISMKVLLLPARPDIFTQISSSSAPRSFTWKVTQKGQFEFKSSGGDMNKDALEILIDRQQLDSTSFLYTENWTGRVSRKDKKTRIKSWYNDPVYPVALDPSPVNKSISINTDDGYDFLNVSTAVAPRNPHWRRSTMNIGRVGGSTVAYGGVRFQNLGIPVGATITSATLTLNVRNKGGSAHCKVYSDITVSNPPTWGSASAPSQITKSVSASWIPTTVPATNNILVTNQVVSAMNVAGWASNHAMRFGIFPENPHLSISNSQNYVQVYDYTTNLPKASSIVIAYSVASSAHPRFGDMNFMGV